MEKAKITVFMPNYNNEPYLNQSIESALSQKTSFPYKILIIDDASTDKSLDILQKFKKKYPKKIDLIINKKNLGYLANTLKGYEIIKTKYFCVLDPDDYWTDAYKLQKGFDFLEKNIEFSIYTTNSYIQTEKEKKPFFEENLPSTNFEFKDLKNAMFGHTSATIFRNIVFTKKIPEQVYFAIGTEDEKIYGGDSFRNIIHLKHGKGHYENNIESVYRITNKGIWTSLKSFEQNSLNANFYIKMYFLFRGNKNFLTKMCSYFCQKNIDILNTRSEKIPQETQKEFIKIYIECLKIIKLSLLKKCYLFFLIKKILSSNSESKTLDTLNKINYVTKN